MPTEQHAKTAFQPINHNTWSWKLFLIYDILMMLIIVVNLLCLSLNAIVMSDFGEWLFNCIHVPEFLQYYQTELHPWVVITESWFISFLICELLIRWFIAIVRKHHKRWFFFPFIHWYEVLAIIPQLRFLRLLRAGVIAYRLHELGYKVIPESLRQTLKFYYSVIMEELSDRVVITVIDGVKYELETSSTHKKIIHSLVDHHRIMFSTALAQILQESLATELNRQQLVIAKNVGNIVNQAIEDTPELTQLLRLLPIVGSRIEQQLQSIGQRLGENIAKGMLEPLIIGSIQHPNATYQNIANKVSQVNIDNLALEQLVESAVFESLEAMREQMKVKQWVEKLEQLEQTK